MFDEVADALRPHEHRALAWATPRCGASPRPRPSPRSRASASSTSRPAPARRARAWRTVGAQVVAADFSRGHDRGRPRASRRQPERRVRRRRMPRRCRSPTTSSTPSPSPSACATSSSPKKALAEFYRVTKPGGRVVICEFSTPPLAPCAVGYGSYLDYVMPTHREARQLERLRPTTTSASRSRLARPAHAQRAGCATPDSAMVAYRNLTLGIVALHRGIKTGSHAPSAVRPGILNLPRSDR